MTKTINGNKDKPKTGNKTIIATKAKTNCTTILHNEGKMDKIELATTAVSLVNR